jgi:DNA-binding NtrC family response regulator
MRKARILIVEDEVDILEFLKELLVSEGYTVSTALEGEVANSLLENQKFDLLIADVKMPKISGLEVLKKAREFDPDILGILITGDFTFRNDLQELEHMGVYDWLFKPLEDINQLLFTVRKALEHREYSLEIKRLKDEVKVLTETVSQLRKQLSPKKVPVFKTVIK